MKGLKIFLIVGLFLALCIPAYAQRIEGSIIYDSGREEAYVTNNSLDTNLPSSVTADTVVAEPTARALANTQTIYAVTITIPSGTNGNVYIGGSGVTTSAGYLLVTNDSVRIKTDNLSDIYIVGDWELGDNVHFIGEVR